MPPQWLSLFVQIGGPVLLALFLFGDVATLPMELWDESRLAVNAVEMAMTGERLVTTYGFQPDLWNTKPPLVINLMAWSGQAFGFTTAALRLPSAIAAFVTVLLLGWLVRRVTGSLGAALAAAVLLAASPGFHGHHAGQTGDYDALLVLFTTGYGAVLFMLLESERPRHGLAAMAGLLIGLAVLTKSVAGIIPGVGIAAYALVFGRVRLWSGAREFALAGAIAALLSGGFYLLRGTGDPRYLAAVAFNELGGRFGSALEKHSGEPWIYLKYLAHREPAHRWPLFALGWLAVAGAVAPWLLAGRERRLAWFALAQAVGVIAVYSAATTKLFWYVEPALPFISVAVALAGLGAVRWTRRFGTSAHRVALTLAGLAVAFAAAQAVVVRYALPAFADPPPRAFGRLIAAAAARGALPLAVLDHGYQNDAQFPNYAPTLRFASLVARRDGRRVDQVTGVDQAAATRFVGSCDPKTRDAVADLGPWLWAGDGCVLAARR